jgi:hypothetical protein
MATSGPGAGESSGFSAGSALGGLGLAGLGTAGVADRGALEAAWEVDCGALGSIPGRPGIALPGEALAAGAVAAGRSGAAATCASLWGRGGFVLTSG